MKRKIERIALGFIMLFIISVCSHLLYLNSMTAEETYPADTFLSTVKVKKALIITAHDDDAYSFSGSIFKLSAEGWSLRQISFKRKEQEKNEMFYKAASLQKMEGVDLIATPYRTDTGSNRAQYAAFPIDSFARVFNHDTIYKELSALIDKFQPTVIFSLDDSIGGYGHPDHVFISKLVVEYCEKNRTRAGFSVQRIYQAVFPPSMAEDILVKNSRVTYNPYEEGKKNYKCKGMPIPDVSIDIYGHGKKKKEYMNSYSEHDQKNIAKVSPYYNWYPWWIYFRLFDKEYFRTISVN